MRQGERIDLAVSREPEYRLRFDCSADRDRSAPSARGCGRGAGSADLPIEIKAADHVTERDILLAVLAPDQHIIQVVSIPASAAGGRTITGSRSALAIQSRTAAGNSSPARYRYPVYLLPSSRLS